MLVVPGAQKLNSVTWFSSILNRGLPYLSSSLLFADRTHTYRYAVSCARRLSPWYTFIISTELNPRRRIAYPRNLHFVTRIQTNKLWLVFVTLRGMFCMIGSSVNTCGFTVGVKVIPYYLAADTRTLSPSIPYYGARPLRHQLLRMRVMDCQPSV